jgi:hypothetical protein
MSSALGQRTGIPPSKNDGTPAGHRHRRCLQAAPSQHFLPLPQRWPVLTQAAASSKPRWLSTATKAPPVSDLATPRRDVRSINERVNLSNVALSTFSILLVRVAF